MDIFFFVHLLLTFSLITIPFWSINYLEYGVYIPLIISIIWIIFNGCPVTRFHKIDSNTFTQDIFKLFYLDINDKCSEHINTFILLFVTVIGFYRLKNNNIQML
jgi:hypothetical protein